MGDGSRRTLAPALAGALGLALAAGACAGTMSIGELMDDPARHDGETVRVEGEVEEAAGLGGPGVYRLRDDTGSLPVIARAGGAPRSGTRVRVEGTFRAVFQLGPESVAVLQEEERSAP